MGYIITKQTAAVTSETIDFTREPFPKTVFVAGLLNDATKIAVNVVDTLDSEAAPLPLYDGDGIAVTLTATARPLTIPGPIHLQFVKDATTAAVGLRLQEVTV